MPDKLLPDFVDKAAENALGPVSTGIGKTFGDLWFLVFGGISQVAEKRRIQYSNALDLYKKGLTEKIDAIPPERRIEPNTQVALKALSESQACIEEPRLREMFANLIASSMDAERAGKTHPSFATIISNLNSFDAQLFADLAWHKTHPLINYTASEPKSGNAITLASNVLAINGVIQVDLETVSQSIDTLSAQGLVRTDYLSWLSDDRLYAPFEEGPIYEYYKGTVSLNFPSRVLNIAKGLLQITDLGNRFKAVCL